MTDKIVKFLCKKLPNLEGIYLFGSRAKNQETQTSDWDLALLSKEALNSVQLFEISQELAIELKNDVDLVDLKSTTTVFQFQVVSTGKRIFCKDEYFCDTFDYLTYSFYQKLNEERKEILEEFYQNA